MAEVPERNLAFELARVTEAAAMGAARWQGRGNKEAVDQAAVDGMRLILNSLDIDGTIVIGEGEKDEAPMLANGEKVGTGRGDAWDVAVDPVDGTTLTAAGIPGAIAVIGMAARGSMYAPGSLVYMEKIAVGPEAAGKVDLEAPIDHNLRQVAKARGKDLNDLTAVILDRPRNQRYVDAVRATGARIRLIHDGDVAGAIATADEDTGIDVLLGIGGSPEAVIAASALSCIGAEIQCRLWPRDDTERAYAAEHGHDLTQVLTTHDLVDGERVVFAATGVTGGEFLDGVHFVPDGAITHSIMMRAKTGSIRHMTSRHDFTKLRKLSPLVLD
jgi:fructose-1,6-bisphosphatase II